MKKKLKVIVTIMIKDSGGTEELDIPSEQYTKFQFLAQPSRALQIQDRIEKLIGPNNIVARSMTLHGDK